MTWPSRTRGRRAGLALAAAALPAAACVARPFTAGGDAADSAPASFCAGEAGALFCADFDAPGDEKLGFDRLFGASGARIGADTTAARSAPASLLASGEGISRAFGEVTIPRRVREVALRFALRVETLPTELRSRGLRVAALYFEGAPGGTQSVLFLVDQGRLRVVEAPAPARESTVDLPAELLEASTWIAAEITGAAAGPSDATLAVRLRTDTTEYGTTQLVWAPPAGHTAVRLEVGGTSQAQGAGRWQVRYDDVVLRDVAD